MTHDNVTDIVEKLQFFAPYVTRPQTAKMMTEAAEEIISLRKQLENARRSLYQCYRSSRDDALESHPDWAEHIADINRESSEAIARINEALKGQPC